MNNAAENIINLITKIKDEEVIFIKGQAFLIRPAEVDDLDRVNKGTKCMD